MRELQHKTSRGCSMNHPSRRLVASKRSEDGNGLSRRLVASKRSVDGSPTKTEERRPCLPAGAVVRRPGVRCSELLGPTDML
jgi:hypothetical protein